MERLTSGRLRDLLEQAGPALINGSANVISVSAIRDCLGEKWARRREQVGEFVERAFSRATARGGLVVPLNDVEYIVLHPEATRWEALRRSAVLLRETLAFFLGRVEQQDIRLMEVTGFTNGELAVQSVDSACFAREAEAEAPVGGEAVAPPWSPLVAGRGARRARLVAGQLEIEAAHSLQPVWNTRNKTVTSFLVDTQVYPSPTSQLPSLASAEVACSSLVFAAEQIHACLAAGAPVALHAPVPHGALTVQAGRHALFSVLKRLPADVRRLLVLELTDLPAGVPQSRLSEAVAMLAPHARAVLARAPSESASLLHWRRCGLNGITLDCQHFEPSDRTALKRLSRFAHDALGLAPACVGYSVGSMSLLVSAWAAGFTHLNGEVVSKEANTFGAVRLPPSDLYGSAAA